MPEPLYKKNKMSSSSSNKKMLISNMKTYGNIQQIGKSEKYNVKFRKL